MFSGGGGAAIGIRAAGARPLWGVEYDKAIADVYRQNLGNHIIVDDVANVDFSTLAAPDILQASPVCKEFSQAKTNGTEGEADIKSAQAVCRAITTLAPRVFLLENVGAYQHSKSYKLICRALDLAGYMWHAEVLNSADFAVPQSRYRLILRAVRDKLLPGLTFDPWVGWYPAIKDLTPMLPKSKFPPWQQKLYGKALRPGTPQMFPNTTESQPRNGNMPAHTVTASDYKNMRRIKLPDDTFATITTEVMARLQTLPRNYRLAGNAELDSRIVGNMVPSLLMQKIVEPLL
jgi:DNA (cytosine-5)-methyltransferase 1